MIWERITANKIIFRRFGDRTVHTVTNREFMRILRRGRGRVKATFGFI